MCSSDLGTFVLDGKDGRGLDRRLQGPGEAQPQALDLLTIEHSTTPAVTSAAILAIDKYEWDRCLRPCTESNQVWLAPKA